MPMRIKIKKKTIPTNNANNSVPVVKSAKGSGTGTGTGIPLTAAQWTVKQLPLDYDRIIHLSDVHIRPLQRHDEFRQVFAQVKETLSNDNQGAITVITGDFFDNKTTFKPETFMLGREFLKMITDYTPLVMIAGNHDMMENNTNRLDAITPVVDDIPNLYYLKTTGLYHCQNDVTFVVSSLYDKAFIHHQDIVDSKHFDTDRHYCALYHGALNGATSDTGYVVGEEEDGGAGTDEVGADGVASELQEESSTRYRSPSDFDGFYAVLLGDIHKHQIFKRDQTQIAYAGSLIQQNHGETLSGHGLLYWDITKTPCPAPTLTEMPNTYGFVDIICTDGEWINQTVEMPENSYARLIITNCTQTQIDAIVSLVKSHVKTLNITKKQCLTNNIQDFEIPPDIKRKEDELDLIREQARNGNYDPDTIIALHQSYQKELEVTDPTMSTAVWRPVLLEFKNMFGYGGDKVNKIIFRQGITSITAGNTCGKTSTVNIILFSIFGRTPLNPSNGTYTFDIINNRQTSGYVKILLNHGGQYYLIERKTVRQSNKPSTSPILQKLNRYDFSCSIWESSIKGEKLVNRSETRRNNNDTFIRELFGDISDFSLSNLLNKESSLDLLSMAPAEQVKILKKLFKLEVYDAYRDLNKAKLLALETEISDMRVAKQTLEPLLDQSVTADTVTALTDMIDEAQEDVDALKESMTSMNDERKELQGTRTKVSNLIVPVDASDMPDRSEIPDLKRELSDWATPPVAGVHSSNVWEYKIADYEKLLKGVNLDEAQTGEGTTAS